MKFALLVLGSPWSSPSTGSALRFARTLLAGGHELQRVFFYHDAVFNGNRLAAPPSDLPDYPREWGDLAREYQVDLVVCAASAARRGVLNDSEARRHGHAQGNLAEGFEVSGLGQLVESSLQCDRVVTFGP